MANGLKSVELVKMYKKQFPSLQKLICVLKQFLLQRDLNEVIKRNISYKTLYIYTLCQLHPSQLWLLYKDQLPSYKICVHWYIIILRKAKSIIAYLGNFTGFYGGSFFLLSYSHGSFLSSTSPPQ